MMPSGFIQQVANVVTAVTVKRHVHSAFCYDNIKFQRIVEWLEKQRLKNALYELLHTAVV